MAPPPASGDVVVRPETTTAGGEVLAIGAPRFQLTHHLAMELVVRRGANRVFATDVDQVVVWDLDGAVVQRVPVPPASGSPGITLLVSGDGRWIEAGRVGRWALARAPFTSSAPIAGDAGAFLPDGSAIVVETDNQLTLIDTATAKAVATSPSPPSRAGTLAISAPRDTVFWARRTGVLRWDRKANTLGSAVAATTPWKLAVLAEAAPVAVVEDADSLSRLDLATGAMVKLTTRRGLFAIAPSGNRVAWVERDAIRIVDAAGKEVARVATARPATRLAFGDDTLLAYVEDGHVMLHELGAGPRAVPTTARFAGWIGPDAAAVSTTAGLRTLTLSTHAVAAADAKATAALTITAPPGAPAWATWLSRGPDGSVIAAEPSPRHGLPIWRRGDADCPAGLRVWTSKGGERTFSLAPTNGFDESAVDPCWEIAGGYVIAATMKRIEVFDPVTGKRVASLEPGVPPEPIKDPALAHQYFSIAASPTHLALWWRRADVWAPEPQLDPRHHGDLGMQREPACETDADLTCQREYFAELWSLTAKPTRLWSVRLDAKRPGTRTWPLSKVASGPIAFTHDGTHVLLGFDDGDVMIRAMTDASTTRIESLHRAPITRIDVAPGDGFVFTEDEAGEQRVWRLAR